MKVGVIKLIELNKAALCVFEHVKGDWAAFDAAESDAKTQTLRLFNEAEKLVVFFSELIRTAKVEL